MQWAALRYSIASLLMIVVPLQAWAEYVDTIEVESHPQPLARLPDGKVLYAISGNDRVDDPFCFVEVRALDHRGDHLSLEIGTSRSHSSLSYKIFVPPDRTAGDEVPAVTFATQLGRLTFKGKKNRNGSRSVRDLPGIVKLLKAIARGPWEYWYHSTTRGEDIRVRVTAGLSNSDVQTLSACPWLKP